MMTVEALIAQARAAGWRLASLWEHVETGAFHCRFYREQDQEPEKWLRGEAETATGALAAALAFTTVRKPKKRLMAALDDLL